jgi:hypothetical protein
MNLNVILAILIAILGVLMVSTVQLNDLFGPKLAHNIVSVSALLNSLIASILAVLSGNVAMMKNVAALPGVERVQVNAGASPAVASVAVDPSQPKVGGTTDQVQAALKEIAKG